MSNQYLSGAKLTSFTLSELTQAAEMLQASGQFQEAIDLYSQWLQHGKDECKHVAWFNYGWLLQKQNKFDEAAQVYNQLTDNYASYLSGNTVMA
jgi:tetratricopeptide (TPR) repeat protein